MAELVMFNDFHSSNKEKTCQQFQDERDQEVKDNKVLEESLYKIYNWMILIKKMSNIGLRGSSNIQV